MNGTPRTCVLFLKRLILAPLGVLMSCTQSTMHVTIVSAVHRDFIILAWPVCPTKERRNHGGYWGWVVRLASDLVLG